jgi:hypothetical protein
MASIRRFRTQRLIRAKENWESDAAWTSRVKSYDAEEQRSFECDADEYLQRAMRCILPFSCPWTTRSFTNTSKLVTMVQWSKKKIIADSRNQLAYLWGNEAFFKARSVPTVSTLSQGNNSKTLKSGLSFIVSISHLLIPSELFQFPSLRFWLPVSPSPQKVLPSLFDIGEPHVPRKA